ncbi:MAG: hypothetical protein J5I98_24965 [Phaeodactylibacter sp.]|nr:hypothetical protein [Phaeodactylibacter sp.]
MKKNSNKCWWCKNKADSREHIFKRSDLKRIFGNSSYDKITGPIIDDGIRQRKVQGTNSRFVKWKANLCSDCNNARSSSFDKAYDEFIQNIQPFFLQVMKDKCLDLRLIFGEDWSDKYKKLIKYYAKHIGCRLSNHELGVTENIIDFLNDTDKLRDIAFTFEIRPMNQIAALTSNEMFDDNYEVLNAGLFHAMEKNEGENQSAIALFSWLTTGWLSFNYIVQENIVPSGTRKIKSPILRFEIGPIIGPEQFEHLPNIAEKISFIEDFGRTGNRQELAGYYSRIKKN